MVNNFIFIEDGSVDTANLRKILDNSGNTDVRFITYRQGAAKPELVSLQSNIKQEAKKKQIIDKVLSDLSEFIDKTMVCGADPMKNMICEMTYYGSKETFIARFEEFLNRG